MSTVDLSGSLSSIFVAIQTWLRTIFSALDSVIIFPGLTLKMLLLIVVVVGLIIDALFVIIPTDGGE